MFTKQFYDRDAESGNSRLGGINPPIAMLYRHSVNSLSFFIAGILNLTTNSLINQTMWLVWQYFETLGSLT
ncbi:hypothetical protein [Anabaena sp. CCY 0017]|uniref:hypothetical protein n=1 Tax=Anabaena sp. CCY 0017 TaxID=3103866 RepID=UPI0039C685EF